MTYTVEILGLSISDEDTDKVFDRFEFDTLAEAQRLCEQVEKELELDRQGISLRDDYRLLSYELVS